MRVFCANKIDALAEQGLAAWIGALEEEGTPRKDWVKGITPSPVGELRARLASKEAALLPDFRALLHPEVLAR